MLTSFYGNTADEVWTAAFHAIKHSRLPKQPSRGGHTKELLHTSLSITDPRQRWILSRRPALNPAFAIAEIIWIMTGRNDLHFLKYWFKWISKYVGPNPRIHGAYGFRLIKHFGFDQLTRAYHALESKPATRQVVLQIWDPKQDFPFCSGRERSKDIPCNVLSLVKIRNSRLEWMQIMRSNDLYRGLPYNLIQFTSMQEIMAGWLGVSLGSFNQISDSLHLYIRDLPLIKIRPPSKPSPNRDRLNLPYRESQKAFRELARAVEQLQNEPPKKAVKPFIHYSIPTGHCNLLRILVAEHCRRRGWPDMAEHAIDACTNPALVTAWRNWIARHDRRSAC